MGPHRRCCPHAAQEGTPVVPPSFQAAAIDTALARAEAAYHKVVLIVGRTGSGKSTMLRSLSQQMPLVNLGLDLSAKLLPLTTRERKLKAPDIVAELLDAHTAPRLAVDNTEIVFDPALMLNPLGLLQSISRTRLLVWSWNGSVENGHVTYAYPGHPEYQRIPAHDLTLVALV